MEELVEQQWPDVLALMIADHVHRDPFTGKYFILGTFAAIFAQSFPCTYPIITVYAAVTNGHDQTTMKMRLTDVDDSREPVFEEEAAINFPDPLVTVEIVFIRAGIVFPEPGEYRLQLYGAGQLLKERRLIVAPLPSLPQPPPEEE